MLLDTTEAPLNFQASEDLSQLSFSIQEKDISHIILLLRQNLYSNPIEAVCREVASNSRDANREAGNEHIPIKISIGQNPFLKNATGITFEDQGPGISPQRMQDVFINYGASTKRDNNTQTGGFGLGAKTPFAYGNSFLIDTVSEGLRTIYMAIISAQNRGGILTLFQEEDPSLESGTRITVPLKEEDRIAFEKACYKATMLWDVPPVYIGFDRVRELQSIKRTSAVNGQLQILSQSRNNPNSFINFLEGSSVGVLLDGIPYPLMGHSSFQEEMRPFLHFPDNTLILLSCPVGSVSITPSRESLHYDERTTQFIKNLFKEAILEAEATVKREIASGRTPREIIQSNSDYAPIMGFSEVGVAHKICSSYYQNPFWGIVPDDMAGKVKNLDFYKVYLDRGSLRKKRVSVGGLFKYPLDVLILDKGSCNRQQTLHWQNLHSAGGFCEKGPIPKSESAQHTLIGVRAWPPTEENKNRSLPLTPHVQELLTTLGYGSHVYGHAPFIRASKKKRKAIPSFIKKELYLSSFKSRSEIPADAFLLPNGKVQIFTYQNQEVASEEVSPEKLVLVDRKGVPLPVQKSLSFLKKFDKDFGDNPLVLRVSGEEPPNIVALKKHITLLPSFVKSVEKLVRERKRQLYKDKTLFQNCLQGWWLCSPLYHQDWINRLDQVFIADEVNRLPKDLREIILLHRNITGQDSLEPLERTYTNFKDYLPKTFDNKVEHLLKVLSKYPPDADRVTRHLWSGPVAEEPYRAIVKKYYLNYLKNKRSPQP